MSVPMQDEIKTFEDIIRLLQERPALREQLRQLLLTQELLALPQQVAQLAEAVSRLERQVERLAQAQERAEERLGRLEERVGALEERVGGLEEQVGRLEERVDRLEEAVARLAEAQARTEERVGRLEDAVARLAEAQARTEEALARLAAAQARTEERMDRLEQAWDDFRRFMDMKITGLGARWGIFSEKAFREAMAHFMARVGLTTERFVAQDKEGLVLGRPATIEMDILVRDGALIVAEVKSSISEADVFLAERKAQFVSQLLGKPIGDKVVVSPFIDPRARKMARELGWRVFTGTGRPR